MVKRTGDRTIEPGRFDAFRLATRAAVMAGQIDATRLGRLAERLAATEGAAMIVWSIEGGRDGRERPVLTVTVQGELPLVCQRCLHAFDVRVDQRSELLLAHDEAELARLDAEDREVVLASKPIEALTLVEDELLLSLPFAPMHPAEQCPMPEHVGGAGARTQRSAA